jgi:hypothetical protein
MQARDGLQTKKGDGMKRLHVHVVVESLPEAIRFYSSLFSARPCCGGKKYANWRIVEPPLNLAASVTDRPIGLAHFGLEVERGEELPTIDRVLRSSLREAGVVPWEVSVRNQHVERGV